MSKQEMPTNTARLNTDRLGFIENNVTHTRVPLLNVVSREDLPLDILRTVELVNLSQLWLRDIIRIYEQMPETLDQNNEEDLFQEVNVIIRETESLGEICQEVSKLVSVTDSEEKQSKSKKILAKMNQFAKARLPEKLEFPDENDEYRNVDLDPEDVTKKELKNVIHNTYATHLSPKLLFLNMLANSKTNRKTPEARYAECRERIQGMITDHLVMTSGNVGFLQGKETSEIFEGDKLIAFIDQIVTMTVGRDFNIVVNKNGLGRLEYSRYWLHSLISNVVQNTSRKFRLNEKMAEDVEPLLSVNFYNGKLSNGDSCGVLEFVDNAGGFSEERLKRGFVMESSEFGGNGEAMASHQDIIENQYCGEVELANDLDTQGKPKGAILRIKLPLVD